MLGAGLIKKVPDEQKYYDTFRDRIMFPICDAVGKVIAFSGRALKEDEKTPKYLNSPETKLFYKSEVLYGLNLAKNHIRKLDYAVLVEGQMDLIMSHHAGVLNTVASSGTALTELHLKKIKKLTNKVLIAYDSDSAGEKAAGKAAALALSLGMEAKVASLPEGEDPASVVKENPEKWKAALRQSEHFIDFILEKTVKENQNKNLAKSVAKNVLPFIPLLQSEMEKSQFVKKISLKAKVTEESVWSDLDKIKTGDKNKGVEKTGDYRDEKEAFLFEAERYGLRIDVEKIEEESVKRNELKDLKKNLQEIAATLDDKSLTKEKEREVKSDFERVQKRIKELSKI
jgi:DNA primase